MSNYEKLAAINVNEKVEKKNGLSYLSWAFAVDTLMRADPEANWTYLEPLQFGDTLMVRCAVTAFGKTMVCQLPVMDYKNRAIPQPDAFAVNTAMQRCLVKAIALHGLGLYIYAGEDLPEGEEPKGRKPNPATFKAWNALTNEHKLALINYRDGATLALAAKDPVKAAKILFEDMVPPEGLGRQEAGTAIWSCFDSTERSAMEAARKELQPAANEERQAA